MRNIFLKASACGTAMLLLVACGGQRHDEHAAAAHEEHAGEIVIAPEQAQAAGIVAEEIRAKSFRQVIAVSGEILPAQSLKQAMSAYDLDLMRQSFRLLGQALEGGQLTWHEYFVELEALVRRGQSYLKLESRYQKLLADIYADSL